MNYRENKKSDLRKVGHYCRSWRQNHYIQVLEIAEDLGTVPSNILRFENGENDSFYILLWYIRNGMPVEPLKVVKK